MQALADDIPFFVDATAVAGLDHTYQGDEAFIVGGGVAAFDCNADAMPDLAIAGAQAPLALYRNSGRPGRPPAFQRFELDDEILRATGVYPLDIDSDGELDMFVLRFGQNKLLRGLGDCYFEDATADYGLPEQDDWTTAFAAHWEAEADLPTLFIGNYVPRDRPLQADGNCQSSYVLRPQGAKYGAPVSLGPGACTLSAMFLDWSGTGRFDLRLANDREYYDRGMSEQMFRLTDNGVRQFTRDDGWDNVSLWGMGLAAQDITGDGLPEVVVTSMADNRMESLRNDAQQPRFDDIARKMGATAQRPYVGSDVRPSTAWHTQFGDANNDGWADLLIVKGNVDAMPKMAGFDPDSLLLGGPTGFREVGYEAGIAVDTKGRGAAFADLNGDGALDILTINRNQPVRLFSGKPMGNWIAVDPRANGINAYAVGATVEVKAGDRTQRQTRAIGGGHASGQLLPLHFGIGQANSAEVRVIWANGEIGSWHRLSAGETEIVYNTAE